MAECLHCKINEVVQKHIDGNEDVDVAEMAAKMTESLVELILLAPEQEHAKLMAEVVRSLGLVYLEEMLGDESAARH